MPTTEDILQALKTRQIESMMGSKYPGLPSSSGLQNLAPLSQGVGRTIAGAVNAPLEASQRIMQRGVVHPQEMDRQIARDALVAGPFSLLPAFGRALGGARGLGTMGGKISPPKVTALIKGFRGKPEFEELADKIYQQLRTQRMEISSTAKMANELAGVGTPEWNNLVRLQRQTNIDKLGETAERAAAWELYTKKLGEGEFELGAFGGRGVTGNKFGEDVKKAIERIDVPDKLGKLPQHKVIYKKLQEQFPGQDISQKAVSLQISRNRQVSALDPSKVTPEYVMDWLQEANVPIEKVRQHKGTYYVTALDNAGKDVTIRIPTDKYGHRGQAPRNYKPNYFDTGSPGTASGPQYTTPPFPQNSPQDIRSLINISGQAYSNPQVLEEALKWRFSSAPGEKNWLVPPEAKPIGPYKPEQYTPRPQLDPNQLKLLSGGFSPTQLLNAILNKDGQ